jgi:hypothetical protein
MEVSKKIIGKERKGKEKKGKEKKGRERKGRERKKRKEKKSHAYKVTKVLYFTFSWGGTTGAISLKLGALVHVVNVINSAKFYHCSFNGLNLARSKFLIFLCLTLRLIKQG